MKKVLILTALLAMVATSAIAAPGIVGSAHDLSVSNIADGGSNTEICVYCHTPHAAIADANTPLWNRTNGTVVGAYANTTMNATAGALAATDTSLCISCHDGSSLSTMTNPPNNGTVAVFTTDTVSAAADISAGDLDNDHPIGFVYDAALATADGELVDPTADAIVMGLLFNTDANGGEMWCSSCHDVHDNTNGQFLNIANGGSALCTTCHNK